MYQADGIKTLIERKKGAPKGDAKAKAAVGSTTVLLGVTSMLTDISSEMVNAVLPLYLVFSVGLSPLAYGAIDGLYQGASALVRVLGGFFSDRWRRHKEVATAGYALSAASRIAILVAGASGLAITLVVLVDRIGKGIRTAPRDALITLTSAPERLGYAFGVHRAFDTFGAMLGPLVAFGLLHAVPGGFDLIFVISFCFAVLGVSVLALFVKNVARTVETKATLRTATALLRRRGMLPLVLVAGFLGMSTISDAFVYLSLQRQLDFDAGFLPLLYVGSAGAFALFAVPFGRLADRFGRLRVFFFGYALLPLVYSSLLLDFDAPAVVVGYLVVLGMFYAATDGVLMAYTAQLLPKNLEASGLSIVATANALAKLLASVIFGAVWTWFGLHTAVVAFGIAIVVSIAFAATVFRGLHAAR